MGTDPSATSLSQVLAHLEGVLLRVGSEFEGLRGRMAQLNERLLRGRLHLAILGQFKRGKSTFLNALLGEHVLPTDVVPLTALPTFVRHGTSPELRVHFQDGRDPWTCAVTDASDLRRHLARYVTEVENPHNREGVAQVDVLWPAPVLERGVVLIDTPGVGSTHRHNTEATLNFLPQCDAAIFLLSADPPVTEAEVHFLREVRSRVPQLFFVLNKVDYLDDEERASLLGFLGRVLTEQVGLPADTPIFPVSARRGLKARLERRDDLWESSGMARVERHLADFLAREKTAALARAVGRKAIEAVDEALMQCRLQQRALRLPLEDLEARLARFEQTVEETRRERQATADRLAGDHRRVHEWLEEHCERLRRDARTHLQAVVDEHLSRDGGSGDRDLRERLEEVIPEWFERQSGQSTAHFRDRIAELTAPHVARIRTIGQTLRETAAQLFEIPVPEPPSSDPFEVAREPYWVTHRWSSALDIVFDSLVERLAPGRWRESRRRRRWAAQLDTLIMSNVENLRWSLFQSIDQTFRRLAGELEERFEQALGATHGAIRAALERRRREGAEAAAALERWSALESELTTVRNRLEGLSPREVPARGRTPR